MTSFLFRLILVGSVSLLLISCSSSKIPPIPPAPLVPAVAHKMPHYQEVSWDALPGWNQQHLLPSFQAWQNSCLALKKHPIWQKLCEQAQTLTQDETTIRQFIETTFAPLAVTLADGSVDGVVTGYYEPELLGDKYATYQAQYPLYAAPKDLIRVELDSLYPEIRSHNLRGRIEGNKLLPYYSRAEITAGQGKLTPIAWANDAIELFFLQIQGSGRIKLPNGEILRIGYADHNGHPFLSIATWLIRQGEIEASKASMQGIKAWAKANPHKVPSLLNINPRFVFFREMDNNLSGPIGALGVPLTESYSVAVDRHFTPLGAPLYLTTQHPTEQKPLQRLMVAQDTGAAIQGPIRIDFFWGSGEKAGHLAGKMKHKGQIWILWPKGVPFPAPGHRSR